MKVFVITPHLYIEGKKSFEHNKTGFSIMVLKIVEGLSKAGVDVRVLAQTSLTKEFNWKGAEFLRFRLLDIVFSAKLIYLKLAAEMIKKLPQKNFTSILRILYWCLTGGYAENIIRRDKPEVVNIHSTMAPTVPILLACSRCRTKCVLTVHAADTDAQINSANTPFRFLFNKIQMLAGKKGIPVIAVSGGLKKQLLEIREKNTDDNIYVICNGTDLKDTKALRDFNIRKKHGIRAGQKVVLCIGSICECKNQLQLLRAMSLMNKSILNTIKVLLLGNNMLGEQIYEEIERNSLVDFVEVCGFIQREELIAYYQQSDFNVLLSISEGFGLSIIEARSFGLPTLTFSDLDAVTDVYDSACMHLVEDRKDEILSRELEKYIEKVWDKNKIKERSKGFSLEDVGTNYLKAYSSIGFSDFSSSDVFSLFS